MSVIDETLQPCIAIDFDDTICESLYPECGALKPGAKEALQRFRKLGYLILIYSCRSCHWHYAQFGGSREVPVMERHQVKLMKEFLDQHQLPYDEIDDGSRGKAFAAFYVDDKAVRYDNNWNEVVRFIEDRTRAQSGTHG